MEKTVFSEEINESKVKTTTTTTLHATGEEQLQVKPPEELLQSGQKTDAKDRQERTQSPEERIAAYRESSGRLVQDGLDMVNGLKMKSLGEAEETTVRYQHDAQEQKAAKSKRQRNQRLKDQDKRDLEAYDELQKKRGKLPDTTGATANESTRAIRQKAKNSFSAWRAATKKLAGLVFKKELNEEYQKNFTANEFTVNEKKQQEPYITAQLEKTKTAQEAIDEEIAGQKKEIELLKKERDKSLKEENLRLFKDEDPMEDIKQEIISSEMDRLDAMREAQKDGFRTDPFGTKRKENAKKYAKAGVITAQDITTLEQENLPGHAQDEMLSSKQKKLIALLQEDINNLLNNIEVDQILSGETYELPESLMTGIKSYIVYRGMGENLVAEMTMRSEEISEKIKTVEEQIKACKAQIEELEAVNWDHIAIAGRSKERQTHYKSTEEAMEVLDKRNTLTTDLEVKLTDDVKNYEKQLTELKAELQTSRKAKDDVSAFTLKMTFLDRQGNSYVREMRKFKAIGLAIQLVRDDAEGDYRESMLNLLQSKQEETKRMLDGIVRSVFQIRNEKTGEYEEKTDQQLDIIMAMAHTYDKVRALKKSLPEEPAKEAGEEEKRAWEKEMTKAKAETDQLMNEAREKVLSYQA